jgi:GNAT superfamily N-acetyltransferase
MLIDTVLHILVTDPDHHRRGAGAKLIRWGTERADDAQLPSFLEASLMGRAVGPFKVRTGRDGYQYGDDQAAEVERDAEG